jgi:hypothetical protein
MCEEDGAKMEAVCSSRVENLCLVEDVAWIKRLIFVCCRTVTLDSLVRCTKGFDLSVVYLNDTW